MDSTNHTSGIILINHNDPTSRPLESWCILGKSSPLLEIQLGEPWEFTQITMGHMANQHSYGMSHIYRNFSLPLQGFPYAVICGIRCGILYISIWYDYATVYLWHIHKDVSIFLFPLCPYMVSHRSMVSTTLWGSHEWYNAWMNWGCSIYTWDRNYQGDEMFHHGKTIGKP